MNRRNFLLNTSIISLGIPALIQQFNADKTQQSEWTVAQGSTILFQGDSITDGGRNKGRYYANQAGGMGGGYVQHIVTELLGKYPEKGLRCYNRGISGHKVFQLAERWEDDCLQLKPDVLSILIGVNDFWHTLTHNYKGTVDIYESDLRALLDRTLKELPDVRLIVAEPFVIKGGSAIDEQAWIPAFNAYQKAAKKIAQDYKATFIPLQSIFDKALEKADVKYWCPDGVHPSMAGSYLMAQAWLAALKFD
ncbi:MAG: SGNH/GDSL hydrolase family protein [Bacteroidota bacterium]